MSNPYASPHSNNQQSLTLECVKAVRVLQIIVAALMMGVLVFMGITLLITGGELDGTPDILSWIGFGFAGLMFVNHLVIPNVVSGAMLKSIDSEELRKTDTTLKSSVVLPALRVKIIIAFAMLEGAAFLNLIAYMLSKFGGNLAAAAVLVGLIAIRFPTTSSVEFWVQDRIREIEMR